MERVNMVVSCLIDANGFGQEPSEKSAIRTLGGEVTPPRLTTGSAKNDYLKPVYLDRWHGQKVGVQRARIGS
jgi:hypothetical protein